MEQDKHSPKNEKIKKRILQIMLGAAVAFILAFFTAHQFFRLSYRSTPIQIILLSLLSLVYFCLYSWVLFWLIPFLKNPKGSKGPSLYRSIPIEKILLVFFLFLFFVSILITIQPYPRPWAWKKLPIDLTEVQPTDHGPYGFFVYMGSDLPGMLDGSYTMSRLFENDRMLGPANSQHADIGQIGEGRFSLWKDSALYFSTSDNTDPRGNGRSYVLAIPVRFAARWINLAWLLTALNGLILAFYLIWKNWQYVKAHWKQMLKNQKVVLFIYFPLLLILIFLASSAYPIIYGMSLCIYYPVAILLTKMAGYKKTIIGAMVVILFITFSRFSPASYQERILDTTDLTTLSFYDVAAGDEIEQDFYLPDSNWRLERLFSNDDIFAVLRIIGDIDENANISINDHYLGTVAELLRSKSAKPMYNIPHAYNYLLDIPKQELEEETIITLRIGSDEPIILGYSNGIAPLPRVPHARLLKPDGEMEDISEQYSYRRFRFSMAFYLASTEDVFGGDHLIKGSIH